MSVRNKEVKLERNARSWVNFEPVNMYSVSDVLVFDVSVHRECGSGFKRLSSPYTGCSSTSFVADIDLHEM